MAEEFTEGHYVLGIEGLALLRAGAGRELPRSGVVPGVLVWEVERPAGQPFAGLGGQSTQNQ